MYLKHYLLQNVIKSNYNHKKERLTVPLLTPFKVSCVTNGASMAFLPWQALPALGTTTIVSRAEFALS